MPDHLAQQTNDVNPAMTNGDSNIAALRAELAELRARMDAYERILQIRDAAGPAARPQPEAPAASATFAPLPTHFDIAADQLLPAQDGFYQLEWGPEGAFRWTGPAPDVHFEAWIDRSQPLVATAHIFHFGIPANAKDLTIEVDGTAYAFQRQGDSKVLRSDPIAPRPGSGATRLTLRIPHVHSPSARGGTDKRTLGVALQRLRLDRP